MRIAVLGGGSWGTALGHNLALKGHDVTILVRQQDRADTINFNHENQWYLPGLPLAASLRAGTTPQEILPAAEAYLLAVPCQYLRGCLTAYTPFINARAAVVCAGKGIEVSNLCRMQEVVEAVLPGSAERYAIISGPSFAQEVVLGKPTAVVLGCADKRFGELLREAFSTSNFRVYSTTDVIGVELGGALKNIMAIAAGICDGLDLGHNARAALITRGLAEISRLGVAMGAVASTFMGLSGMGDLVLTCTGDLSRNRQVGMRLGQGQTLEQIMQTMHNVAEGVKTTEAAIALGQRLQVELPITEAMGRVLAGANPGAEVQELMRRALKTE